jgi:Holliday junction resolvase RusA-like endonuclease
MTQRDKWMRRPCVMKYRAWKDRARAAFDAARNGRVLDANDVGSIEICAWFVPLPKKKMDLLGKPHRQKPDADNIAKSVLDTLFDQDQGIADLHIVKRWAACERVEIVIEFNEMETT